MFDLDPRDIDSRDEERHDNTPSRGSRRGSGDGDRDDDWRQPGRSRDLGDDARTLGRGPGNDRASAHAENDARDRRDAARWLDRDREPRERATLRRDTFTRHLRLPRGPERQIVRDRDREYTLRGSESRTLATVGAFRVVSSRDLRDHNDRPADPRSSDLRHLREEGLIETVRVPGYRDHAVVLTKDGRAFIERHRDRDHEHHQTFYAGRGRERELEHDLQIYRALRRGRGAAARTRRPHRARRPRPRAQERVPAVAACVRQGPRRLRRPPSPRTRREVQRLFRQARPAWLRPGQRLHPQSRPSLSRSSQAAVIENEVEKGATRGDIASARPQPPRSTPWSPRDRSVLM
jgi:hypothetical protein